MKKGNAIRLLLVAAVVAFGLTGAASANLTGYYVFGDSLSDVGNMLIISGGTIPDPAVYWEGRLSNGPVAAEYYAPRLPPVGTFGLSPSESGGNGYAFDRARTSTHESGPQYSVLGQVNTYLSDAGGAADPGAGYVVWAGANNLRDALMDPANAAAIVTDALGDMQTVLTNLIGNGAHHLLVPNAPDLGLVPAVTSMGPTAMAGATALSAQYNAGLEQVLQGFDPLANIRRFDTFAFTQNAVSDPLAYGFTNVTEPYILVGAGDPDEFLFWDPIHPTTRTHEILGGELWPVIPEPHVAGLLLVSVALALGVRRRR